MEEFINSLSSPSWWMGVVIVGVIINVASAYLKKPIDLLLSKVSSSWRARQTAAVEKRNALVESLRNDSNLLLLYSMSENRYRIRSVGFLLLAFAIFFMSTFAIGVSDVSAIFGSIFSLFIGLMGLNDHYKAMQVYSIVQDANEKYKDINA